MIVFLEVIAGLGIAIIAIPLSVFLSVFLIRAKLPLVLPGSLAGPVIVAVMAYAIAGIPAAIAAGLFFLLIGIALHPIWGAILVRFGGRSPYLPPDD